MMESAKKLKNEEYCTEMQVEECTEIPKSHDIRFFLITK